MRILVAMSGGVDSSVVANLLHKQGHELIGVRFSLWSDPLAPAIASLLPKKCCNPQTVYRANSVAKTLNIPLHHIDLEKEFKEQVVDPFLSDYASGVTPNPCIGCNRTIKFGKLLDIADAYNCEMLATGHYAQITCEMSAENTKEYALREAVDTGKDQSYFLHGLSQSQLARAMFPLGEMHKSDVMALARQFDIPLPEQYTESQDVCFYPEKEPKEFLKRHIPHAIQPGPIKTDENTVVGTHDGLPLYTIGQRKGLKVGGLKVPLHVVRKEVKSNTIFVAPSGADREFIVETSSLHWIRKNYGDTGKIPLEARINSQGKRYKGILQKAQNGFSFHFQEGVRGIAPGQSIVLYKNTEVLGGGVIREKSENTLPK